ncbi:MAG: PIN domain-containing protein [Nitrososphaerales archaeon]
MLDTNIIIKALIKDSVVRGVILGPKHELFVPEYAIEETRKHLDMAVEKSGLSEGEVNAVLDVLLANVQTIPAAKVLSNWKEADGVRAPIDRADTPFVAAAMGIRSDDKHLGRQSKVKVWRTKDILNSIAGLR